MRKEVLGCWYCWMFISFLNSEATVVGLVRGKDSGDRMGMLYMYFFVCLFLFFCVFLCFQCYFAVSKEIHNDDDDYHWYYWSFLMPTPYYTTSRNVNVLQSQQKCNHKIRCVKLRCVKVNVKVSKWIRFNVLYPYPPHNRLFRGRFLKISLFTVMTVA